MALKHDVVERIFVGTADKYDFDVRLLTLGMDNIWKQNMFREISDGRRQYRRILDLACGTGIVTFMLADRYPDAEIIGADMTAEYLRIAEAKKDSYGYKNVMFVYSSAENILNALPSKKFDLITTSYLPKYVDLDVVIKNCAKLMSSGGVLVVHDFTKPHSPVLQAVYNAYWAGITPLLMFTNWKQSAEVYKILENRWDLDMPGLLKKHRFADIKVIPQIFDVATIVTAVRI